MPRNKIGSLSWRPLADVDLKVMVLEDRLQTSNFRVTDAKAKAQDANAKAQAAKVKAQAMVVQVIFIGAQAIGESRCPRTSKMKSLRVLSMPTI